MAKPKPQVDVAEAIKIPAPGQAEQMQPSRTGLGLVPKVEKAPAPAPAPKAPAPVVADGPAAVFYEVEADHVFIFQSQRTVLRKGSVISLQAYHPHAIDEMRRQGVSLRPIAIQA